MGNKPFRFRLECLRKTGSPAKFLISVLIAVLCVVGLFGAFIGIFLLTTPKPTNIRECLTTELFKVRLCPKSPEYTRLKNISRYLRAAVIASEDGNFYSHKGIDWFELRESLNKNLEKGAYVRGGSTITQQLAKNVYLSAEKSIFRKVREALIAVQIEKILSKDEILEKYLNVVEFGKNIYGVRNAAGHYFKKSPAELSVAESAFLAFLLPSPKNYSISHARKKLTPFARSRMKQIVERMWRLKKIDDYEYDLAKAEINSFFDSPVMWPVPLNDEASDVQTPPEESGENIDLDDDALPLPEEMPSEDFE